MKLLQTIQRARAETKRSKVLVLTNADTSPWDKLGLDTNVVTIPSMSLPILCKTIAESNERIAAIIIETIPMRDLLHKRFMKRARELASAEGSLLIWNEQHSKNYFSYTDLQSFYEIKPDLSCEGL